MFRTHTGRVVTGDTLQAALNKVADDWVQLAHDIRREDAYASHVTEAEKDDALAQMVSRAAEIRAGKVGSLTIWQRVNTELTGECVSLLP